MSELKAKPAGDEPTGSREMKKAIKAEPLSTQDYNRKAPPMSRDALLDASIAALESSDAEFNRPFSRLVHLDASLQDKPAQPERQKRQGKGKQ